jgi:hypothetical protein
MLLAFLAARLVICVRGTVFTSFDTASYGPVSLIGHAPRLWGVPAFYALFPGDHSRAVAQWAVGTVAWALLAWALWTWLRGLAARVVGAGGVLLLAVLPPVANWDFAILSESLSISLGVATLALALLWGRTGSPWILAAMVAVASWWTFTRPDIRVFTLFLIVAFAAVAWRWPALRRGALAGAGVLAAMVVWCTALTPVVDRTYQGWSATPDVRYEEGLLVFRLRQHVLPDPEVRALFANEFGMPSCPAMEEIATGGPWQTARFAEAYVGCPEMRAWGERNAADVWRRYATTAPGLFARRTTEVVKLSLAGADYAKTTRVAPLAVQDAIFPPRRWVLPALAGGLLVAGAALVVSGAWRSRPGLASAAGVLVAASAASVAAGIWYGAGEYWRFGIQEAIGLRLAVLVMAVTAVDAVVTRKSARPSGSPRVPSGVGALAVVGGALLASLLLAGLLGHDALPVTDG